MKVQTDQIKRPKLIEPFFDKELLPDNSFCTYIEVSPCSQKQASDNVASTPSKNISKKSFNNDYKDKAFLPFDKETEELFNTAYKTFSFFEKFGSDKNE